MNTTIAALYEKFKISTGVSTDPQKITEGSLFFALKNDNFNANSLAKEALDNGAKFVVVDEFNYALDDRFLLVENTLTALQKLANYHRKTFTFPIIGLTDSNEKTITKELIAAVLSKKYKIQTTKESLSSYLEIPLTLLTLNETYKMAVIEMEANHQREMHDLCQICEPTHGLIPNIEKGDFEGIKKGKEELYNFLEQTGGTVFVNAKNELLSAMTNQRNFKEKILYLLDNEVVISNDWPFIVYSQRQDSHLPPPTFPIQHPTSNIQTHLTGKGNFENIAATLKIGAYFGVSSDEANEAVAAYYPANNHLQVFEKSTNTIILDTYEATPSAMSASIQHFIHLKTEKKKVVILGDMLELGEETPAEYLAIGELIAKGHFDLVVLAGKLMHYALAGLPKAYYFPDKFSLHNWLIDKALGDSYILIKGSKEIKLETTLHFL